MLKMQKTLFTNWKVLCLQIRWRRIFFLAFRLKKVFGTLEGSSLARSSHFHSFLDELHDKLDTDMDEMYFGFLR